MISPDLLKILCCPESKIPLRLATNEELSKINTQITQGALKKKNGDVVQGTLEGGLRVENSSRIYPIRNQIPVLLIPEAIETEA